MRLRRTPLPQHRRQYIFSMLTKLIRFHRQQPGFSFELYAALLCNYNGWATIESILRLSAAVWYGSCTAHKTEKDLARVVKTAQGIVGSPLPDLDSIYAGRMQKKARHIAADPTHPGNGLFVLLPSGKRCILLIVYVN
ncbi:hypothetical protein L3Q82_004579 [Scortum barcoo]|uniref:Uncharacterized protein n=1 Tax=Scortum barcoo TaxID=214431 RepID=A0ACB8VGK9_9TELE|nr:hypothetical protein L3Q82_004579 [Scortum barcoo]